MSISKPSIAEDSSESDDSDYGEDDIVPGVMKAPEGLGRKISISSTGNPRTDERL